MCDAEHGSNPTGIEAIKGKNAGWVENQEVHGGEVSGPFPNGEPGIVQFKFDVAPNHTGQRMTRDEMRLYTVKNGKFVKEAFFSLKG